MQGFRLHILVVLTVLLTANQLGAKNHGAYQTGQQVLRDRSDYCQYIESSIQNTRNNPRIEETFLINEQDLASALPTIQEKIMFAAQALHPYLGRSVKFRGLPESWKRHLSTKRIILGQKIKEMRRQISALQMEKIASADTNDNYEYYRTNHQLPLQTKTMLDATRKLEHELAKVTEQKFSADDLLEMAAELEDSDEPLGLEFVRSHGWFSNQIHLYPTWKISGKWKRASDEPWLRIDDRFLPQTTLDQLKTRRAPAMIDAYRSGVQHLLPKKLADPPRFYWSKSGNFVVSGSSHSRLTPIHSMLPITSTQDLSVFGLLDLACLSPKVEPLKASKFHKYFKALARFVSIDNF